MQLIALHKTILFHIDFSRLLALCTQMRAFQRHNQKLWSQEVNGTAASASTY